MGVIETMISRKDSSTHRIALMLALLVYIIALIIHGVVVILSNKITINEYFELIPNRFWIWYQWAVAFSGYLVSYFLVCSHRRKKITKRDYNDEIQIN